MTNETSEQAEQDQLARCDRLAGVWDEAKAAAAEAKTAYDEAVSVLGAMSHRTSPDTPLLGGTVGNGAADDEPWCERPLHDFGLGIPRYAVRALAKAGIETGGDLTSFTQADGVLIGIAGIGPGAAAKIKAVVAEQRGDGPAAEEADA
jgi:hypothetical protein